MKGINERLSIETFAEEASTNPMGDDLPHPVGATS